MSEKHTRKFYVNVQGGLGLNLAFASFISYIKENGDDEGNKDYEFYVCSGYFDVFKSCPFVDGVYKPNELKDLVLDGIADSGELILTRLYDMDKFVKKQLNYSQAWAELLKIPFTDTEIGTKVKSNLTPLTAYPGLSNNVNQVRDVIKNNGFEDFIIVQFTGGQSPLVQVPSQVGPDGKPNGQPDWSKVPYNYDNEPLKRHYPLEKAQKFCDLYHEKHPKTAIVLYQLPNEPAPDGDYIVKGVMPYLAYYLLAKDAKAIVTIDSSLQHLTAGLAPTTVIWGHSAPEHFGYSCNKNIVQNCRRNDLFYFTALGPSGARVKYIEPEDLLEFVENV